VVGLIARFVNANAGIPAEVKRIANLVVALDRRGDRALAY